MKIKENNNNLVLILIFISFTQNWIKCAKLNKIYSCGRSEKRNPRIVGGDNAYAGEFPWMASILMNPSIRRLSPFHYCGGLLISDQWVISAAHCVEGYISDNFIVRLGAHSIKTDFEDNAIDIPIESIIIHRNYSRPHPYDNDIALIKLKSKVRFNDYIIPICLPQWREANIGDQRSALLNEYDFMFTEGLRVMGTVVGWGWLRDSDRNQDQNLGDILQKVKLPIISNKDCELWYRSRGRSLTVSATQFCAGFMEGGKDSCRGDSGGPLLVKDATNSHYLIGIVSAGIGCALPQLPGLYTRVDAYIHWIERHVNSSQN